MQCQWLPKYFFCAKATNQLPLSSTLIFVIFYTKYYIFLLAPCLLPQIQNGQYLSGYRAGLTIVNGSGVSFQCDEGYLISTSNQIECALGELFPHNPSCIPHLGISSNISKIFDSPHYLGGRDIVKGGDITDLGYGASIKSCAPPAKLVYLQSYL